VPVDVPLVQFPPYPDKSYYLGDDAYAECQIRLSSFYNRRELDYSSFKVR